NGARLPTQWRNGGCCRKNRNCPSSAEAGTPARAARSFRVTAAATALPSRASATSTTSAFCGPFETVANGAFTTLPKPAAPPHTAPNPVSTMPSTPDHAHFLAIPSPNPLQVGRSQVGRLQVGRGSDLSASLLSTCQLVNLST